MLSIIFFTKGNPSPNPSLSFIVGSLTCSNSLNIFTVSSLFIPLPVSFTQNLIKYESILSFVFDISSSTYPLSVYLTALLIKLINICSILVLSS